MLTGIDLVVLAGYLASLSLIGIYFGKRQVSREEYLLGGRNIHWILAGGSMMATLLSTVSYLSSPGEMIRYGIVFLTGFLAAPLTIPLLNRVLVPILVRLPITSAYEYLEGRFSLQTRLLAALVFIFRTVIWMGLIIFSASLAVSEMMVWNIYLTIVIVGLITAFYTSIGGLRTVIWTDNLQLWILGGGAIVIPVYIMSTLGFGPLAVWEVFGQAGHTEVDFFNFDPSVRLTPIGMMLSAFFWNICTVGGDQVAMQRFLSTPSLKAARRSIWTYIIWSVVLALLVAACGVTLFVFYWQESGLDVGSFQEEVGPRADRLMPSFIAHELPAGVSGLLLAALLAAAMSSLSSGINSTSGVFMTDFVQRLKLLPAYTKGLMLDKLFSFFSGILGIGMAVLIAFTAEQTTWNLFELTGRINHLFVGPIAVLFFGGILFRRAGKRGVVIGFLIGTVISVLICFGKELFFLEKGISFIWVVPASFLIGLAVVGVLGVATPPPSRNVDELTLSGLLK